MAKDFKGGFLCGSVDFGLIGNCIDSMWFDVFCFIVCLIIKWFFKDGCVNIMLFLCLSFFAGWPASMVLLSFAFLCFSTPVFAE